MTTKDAVDAMFAGWTFILVFSWLWLLFMAVLVPVTLISVGNSLRGIRRELRKMNGETITARGGLFPNATVRHVEQPAPSLGHQLLK
jgi:hypothetical protein